MDRNDFSQAAHSVYEQAQIVIDIIEAGTASGSGQDANLLRSREARGSPCRLTICILHFQVFTRVSHARRRRDATHTELLRHPQNLTTKLSV